MKKRSIPLQLLDAYDKIYAKVPAFECKGLCQDSCGMVPMSAFEWHRLVLRHGRRPSARVLEDGSVRCPFLNKEGRCDHHDIRPTICRLWGAVDNPLMTCPHGCRPVTYLTEEESFKILLDADASGGGPVAGQMELVMEAMKKQKELSAQPEVPLLAFREAQK